jgi:hypothetical protein
MFDRCRLVRFVAPMIVLSHRGLLQIRDAALLTACLLAIVPAGAADDEKKWEVASRKTDLTVYERLRKGANLKEFKAVGTIAAPPLAVRQVLDDVEAYPRFMPYVVEARVLSQERGSRISYQRLSPPIVGDRDYTVRTKFEIQRGADGLCYCNRWQAANDLGPAEKAGVTRVRITEGSWLLEPIDDGRQTRATYALFSDSGGKLPAMIANTAGRTAIPKVFDSVRKQVQLEKYQRPQ